MDKVVASRLDPGDHIRFSPFSGSVYEVSDGPFSGISFGASLWCTHDGDRKHDGATIWSDQQVYRLNKQEAETHQAHRGRTRESR